MFVIMDWKQSSSLMAFGGHYFYHINDGSRHHYFAQNGRYGALLFLLRRSDSQKTRYNNASFVEFDGGMVMEHQHGMQDPHMAYQKIT